MKKIGFILFLTVMFFIISECFITKGESVESLVEEARVCIKNKDYDGAIEKLLLATKKNSDYGPIYLYMGSAYYLKGKYNIAIANYKKFLTFLRHILIEVMLFIIPAIAGLNWIIRKKQSKL